MMRARVGVAVVLTAVATCGFFLSACVPGTGATGGTSNFNLPPVPIVSSDVVRGVVPLTVRFTSDASTEDGVIVTRTWDFGDGGTSTDISPTHIYRTTGDFNVRLTLVDDGGLSASRTLTVSVTQAPVAVIATDRTAAPSAPATINFDGSGSFDPDGTIRTYQWDFGDSTRLFVATTPHTYSQPGTYRAQLTVTDDKGVTNATSVIISIGIPTPTIEIRIPPATVNNVVLAPGSPLWIQGVFNVQPGIPHTIRAGLDGDRDRCEAQSVVVNAASGTTALTLSGHADRVTAATYSKDGTLILTASADRTLRLSNATTGDLIQTYSATVAINCVAFSPDASQFAYGQANGQVIVRRRSDGAALRTISAHAGAVNTVQYSQAGDRIVSGGSDRRVAVWNAASGAAVFEYSHSLAVNAVALDATRIASASEDQTVLVRQLSDGTPVTTLTGHNNPVNAVAWSADGALLASGGDDNNVILWDGATFAVVRTIAGGSADISAIGFSPDGKRIASGAADGSVRLYEVATGKLERTVQPCSSAVSSATFSPDGSSLLASIAAANDIQLDTDPTSGNDLNFTLPQALDVSKVPPGEYTLWAEIDTDRTDPVRTYAAGVVNVSPAFTSTIDASTPVVPLVNDRAIIVADPLIARQIYDLGAMATGDRIVMSLVNTPGYGRVNNIDSQYGIMLLDANQDIFTWYQQFGDSLNGLTRFVLLSPDTQLVVAESTPHMYAAIDAAPDISIEVQRGFGYQPRGQRVFVNFAGASGVSVAGQAATNVPVFNAGDFNQFFAASPNWGAAETTAMKAVILQTLRTAYAGYDITFFSSDTTPLAQMQAPFQTLHVGGLGPVGLFGISDYIDPRNDTVFGTAIIYSTGIAQFGVPGFLGTPLDTVNLMGGGIGDVCAHELGHCLGLRHTNDPLDIMQGGGGDLAQPHIFKAAAPSANEQLLGLPSLGIQNAPKTLEQVLGLSP
ncbi:MAG: PKD domain-containing protein [Phycisphaerae bacterium]